MLLRDRGEQLLLAGNYEQAIPLLERSAARNRHDDFANDLMPVVQSLVLLGRCVEAEQLTVRLKGLSFAPTSKHAVWNGWARWVQGDHIGGVKHFLEASKCPYQNFGWALALYCAAVWDPACYSMGDAESSLRLAEKKLPRDAQMSLCIRLASGGISETEFLTRMCEWKGRFRKRWNTTHRAIAHFWIALRHWRDPDPTAMLTHLVAAAQPARMMSIPDELILARIILRRMGIDPLMLKNDEMPVIPLSDLDAVRAQATCTLYAEASGSKNTLPAAGTSSASQLGVGSVTAERCQPGVHSDSSVAILGGFATIAVVAGSSRQRLEAGLKALARRYNVSFRPVSSTAVQDHVAICSIRRGTFSISLPWTVNKTERLVRDLSRDLSCSVLWLHVHDGDLWMYKLYCNGRIMDRFDPLPDYWPGTRTKRMVAMWAGNADRFAQWWPGIAPAAIDKYLRRWDETEMAGRKAYPDDVFQYGDCSQAQDFLRRLGAVWPDCATPSISCRTFEFDM